jgi:hypothetical protein
MITEIKRKITEIKNVITTIKNMITTIKQIAVIVLLNRRNLVSESLQSSHLWRVFYEQEDIRSDC